MANILEKNILSHPVQNLDRKICSNFIDSLNKSTLPMKIYSSSKKLFPGLQTEDSQF